ncbi:MAG TPA: uroporphyrinogen-III C-methyltransferase [Candidatus Polarisedimenticolia bacterium]|nr:uroporphyrinogen-III C-methyltransferase [Candidatus Polarisedimenticolia bacterium]
MLRRSRAILRRGQRLTRWQIEVQGEGMTLPHAEKVYLVGAGPGDPELLTVKAQKLLARADVVLHDDLVPAAILALAGPQAEIVNVGKRCGAKGTTQDRINTRMIESARRGRVVVRLKSGDPGIFGRLAEELDALENANVPFEVVPGITAGIAAAAALGASLTDRRTSARVVVVTNHYAQGSQQAERRDWQSLAREDATLVIYMPGQDFTTLRLELLAAGLSPKIPALIVSRATTREQRHQFVTLGKLDELPLLEAPAILLIGRSLDGALRRSSGDRNSVDFDEAAVILSSL